MNSSREHLVLGAAGEEAVAHYLQERGWVIRERNFKVPEGEIDIIARKDEVLAFVEVKSRSALYFNLSQVILPAKQRKIMKAARRYIFNERCRDMVYRFDIALLEQKRDAWDITYFENAFTDSGVFL